MRLLWIVPALVVAGCAHTPTEQDLAGASVLQVCDVATADGSPVSYMAYREARRRGINCADYIDAVMHARSQDQARRTTQSRAVMEAARYFNPPPPPMQPLPQQPAPVQCRTYAMGGSLYTDCR
jgi:hypothetical protein